MTNSEINKYIVKYKPLVRKIATQYMKKPIFWPYFEDILSAGMIGVWKAFKKDKADLSKNIDSWVESSIRWSINSELRKIDWVSRGLRKEEKKSPGKKKKFRIVHLDEMENIELDQLIIDYSYSKYEFMLDFKKNSIQIMEAINALPERNRFIIQKHFFENVELKDICITLRVTPARVSQLLKRDLENLRKIHSNLELKFEAA